MAKLYFLGGERVVKQDSREINKAAFHEAAEEPRVVVFPWARASFDKKYKRRQRLFSIIPYPPAMSELVERSA